MDRPIASFLPDDKPRRLPWWRRWRRPLAWGAGALILAVVGGWLFFNSGFFFRGIVIPALEKKLRAQITVGHVDWSLFGGIHLRDLSVKTTGESPVFQAATLDLRGAAWELSEGPVIEQIRLEDPILDIVVAADGSSNLDSILAAIRSSEEKSEPDISAFSVVNGVVRHKTPSATRELAGLEVTLDRWVTGESAKLKLAGAASYEQGTDRVAGQFGLAATLRPGAGGILKQCEGHAQLDIKTATGAMAKWRDVRVDLDVDWTDTALKRLELKFQDARLLARGARDKATGRWVIEADTKGTIHHLLDSMGVQVPAKIDTQRMTGHLVVSLDGNSWQTHGSFETVAAWEQPVSLSASIEFHADLGKAEGNLSMASVKGFNEEGNLVTARLLEPLRLDWSGGKLARGNVVLELRADDLELGRWKKLLGHELEGGRGDIVLEAIIGSTAMDLDLRSSARRLVGRAGRHLFRDEDIEFSIKGRGEDGRWSFHNGVIKHVARPEEGRQATTLLEEMSVKWHPRVGQISEGALTSSLQYADGADKFSGHFSLGGNFKSNPAGLLAEADANATFEIDSAEGFFADARRLEAKVRMDLAPGRLRELLVDFSRDEKAFGRVSVEGERSRDGAGWKLDCGIFGVDRQVLNFIGARRGLDFQGTVLNATNRVFYTPRDGRVKVRGRAMAGDFSLLRSAVTTPVVDAAVDFDLQLDLAGQQLELARLELSGTQNEQKVLSGRLLEPLRLAWGAALAAEGGSRMELKLDGADLARWKTVLGNRVERGHVDATLNLTARQGVQDLSFGWRATVHGLTTSRVRDMEASLVGQGSLKNLRELTLKEGEMRWREPDGRQFTLTGGGQAELTTKGAVAKGTLSGTMQGEGEPVTTGYGLGYAYDAGKKAHLLNVNVKNVPASVLRRMTLNPRILDGAASLKGEVYLGTNGVRELNLKAILSGLKMMDPEWPPAGADLELVFDGFINDALNEVLEVKANGASAKLVSSGKLWGALEASGGVVLEPKTGRIEGKLEVFKVRGLSPELVRLTTGHPWREGMAEYEGVVEFLGDGAVALDGVGAVKGMQLAPNVPVDLALKGPVVLSSAEKGPWLPRSGDLNATVFKAGRPAGRIELTAMERGRYAAEARGLDVSVLRVAEPVWRQAWGIVSGEGDADVTLAWAPESGLRFKGVADVRDWVVRDRDDGELSTAQSASAVFDMGHHAGRLMLHECVVDLGKSLLSDNRVTVKGTYDFTQAGRISGNVEIHSPAVELLPVLRILDADPDGAKSSGRDIVVDLKLSADRLHWNGLTATNFIAATSVTNKVTEFKSMQMYLEGGPLGAYYRMDRTRPAWAHEVAIAGRQVALAPLLDLFVKDEHKPWVAAQKWGKLDADVRLRWAQAPGQGWDWRSMAAEGLKGVGTDAVLRISGASIAVPEAGQPGGGGLVPGVLKMVVGTLSTAVKAPKLRQAKVESARLVGRVEEGQMRAQIHMRTPFYEAATGGVLALSQHLPDVVLNRLPVALTLVPEMAREFRLGGRLLNNGRDMRLPVFLRLKGQMGEMEAEADPVVLGTIFTAGLSGQAINVPIGVLEAASGVIDKLPVPLNPLNIFFPRKN